MARGEAIHQQLVDKGLGLHLRQPGAEFQQHDLLDAAGLEGRQLLPQAREPGRGRLGGEILHGLGLKGDHRRRQTQFPPLRLELLKDHAMSQVYTIEITYGGDATLVSGPKIVEAADDVHDLADTVWLRTVVRGTDYSLAERR